MKEIKEVLNKWSERLSIFNMSILPKLIYRFKAILIELPSGVLVEIDKQILKFIWTSKGTRLAKTILKKLEEPCYLISR